VIELHQFRRAWGINPSPFCYKVEIYCRLAGIPYKSVLTLPNKSPRGKLPYIVDQGRIVADSSHILDHLRRRPGADLDSGLDVRQRAKGHLLRRTCEESLYFVLVYSRWIDDAGWAVARPEFFRGVPAVIMAILPGRVRKTVRTQLHYQGYGRHSRDEVYALGEADLAAIATALTEHLFAVADRPSSFDATLYALLKNILHPPLESPLKGAAQALPLLTDYVRRIDQLLEAQPG